MSLNETKIQVGVVKMTYDETGKVISGKFVPELKIEINPILSDLLKDATSCDSEDITINNAMVVFSSWMSRVNSIELEDRDQWELATENYVSHKHPNGIVSDAYLHIVFRKREEVPAHMSRDMEDRTN